MNKQIVGLLFVLLAVCSRIEASSSHNKLDCSVLFEDPSLINKMSDEDVEICANIFLDRIMASIEREDSGEFLASWEKEDVKRSKPRRKQVKNKIF